MADNVVELVDDSVTMRHEVLNLFVGKRIGMGSFRHVFECEGIPTAVVKIEAESGSFMNAMEWEVWREMQGTKWESWFAPCIRISDCGVALIMERTEPLKAWPRDFQLPSFFQDVKLENFGRLGKRIVCHDYSISHLIRANLRGVKMVPVKEVENP